MRKRLVYCLLLAVFLCSVVTAHEAEIIDIVWTGDMWLAIDEWGEMLFNDVSSDICGDPFYTSVSHGGACALDYDPDCAWGIVAYPNGDLQPVDSYGFPTVDPIPGPPGASNVEDVIVGDICGSCAIRSGCVYWYWDGTSWTGPCEPFGSGASAAEQETWGKIKAEFGE